MILYGSSGLSKTVMILYNSEGCVSGVMVGTDDKNEIPTDSLPWAIPIQDVTSAGVSGKGKSPTESLKDRGLLDSSQTERKHNNHT